MRWWWWWSPIVTLTLDPLSVLWICNPLPWMAQVPTSVQLMSLLGLSFSVQHFGHILFILVCQWINFPVDSDFVQGYLFLLWGFFCQWRWSLVRLQFGYQGLVHLLYLKVGFCGQPNCSMNWGASTPFCQVKRGEIVSTGSFLIVHLSVLQFPLLFQCLEKSLFNIQVSNLGGPPLRLFGPCPLRS